MMEEHGAAVLRSSRMKPLKVPLCRLPGLWLPDPNRKPPSTTQHYPHEHIGCQLPTGNHTLFYHSVCHLITHCSMLNCFVLISSVYLRCLYLFKHPNSHKNPCFSIYENYYTTANSYFIQMIACVYPLLPTWVETTHIWWVIGHKSGTSSSHYAKTDTRKQNTYIRTSS